MAEQMAMISASNGVNFQLDRSSPHNPSNLEFATALMLA
jgi:hypothetical protein